MRSVDPSDEVSQRATGRASRRSAAPLVGRSLASVVDVSDGWQGAARCRDEDATLFFGPNRFEPKQERLEREAEAKAVCARCPVVAACREHALRSAELYGVWGGLGEADRRALLADQGRIARAV